MQVNLQQGRYQNPEACIDDVEDMQNPEDELAESAEVNRQLNRALRRRTR